MLTSDFNQELGSLIRSLEQRVRTEPSVFLHGSTASAVEHLDRAIISLVALRISLTRRDA